MESGSNLVSITALNKMLMSTRVTESAVPVSVNVDKLLSKESLPDKDVPHGKLRYCHGVSAETADISFKLKATNSGNKLYPAGGFLQWHTNSDVPGIRIYFSFATGPGCFFRYMKDGQMITANDKQGWNIRAFHISREFPLWHCVYAACSRYSFGFNTKTLPEGYEEYLI